MYHHLGLLLAQHNEFYYVEESGWCICKVCSAKFGIPAERVDHTAPFADDGWHSSFSTSDRLILSSKLCNPAPTHRTFFSLSPSPSRCLMHVTNRISGDGTSNSVCQRLTRPASHSIRKPRTWYRRTWINHDIYGELDLLNGPGLRPHPDLLGSGNRTTAMAPVDGCHSMNG